MHYLDFASDLRNAVLSKAFVFVFYQAFVVGNGCPRLLPTWCWCSTPKAQEVSNTLIRLEAYFSTAKTLNWSCGWKRAHKLSNACWNSWPGHICMHLFFLRAILRLWIGRLHAEAEIEKMKGDIMKAADHWRWFSCWRLGWCFSEHDLIRSLESALRFQSFWGQWEVKEGCRRIAETAGWFAVTEKTALQLHPHQPVQPVCWKTGSCNVLQQVSKIHACPCKRPFKRPWRFRSSVLLSIDQQRCRLRFEASQKKLQDAEKAAAEQQKKFTELEVQRRSKQLAAT